jgi:hypothetical protein
MQLSETACEVLDLFHDSHRRPGARVSITTLDARLGTDPAVAVAVSELIDVGYVITPDANCSQRDGSPAPPEMKGADRLGHRDYRVLPGVPITSRAGKDRVC